MKLITSYIRSVAEDITHASDILTSIRVVAEDLSHVPERMFWETKLLKEYGLPLEEDKVHVDYWVIRELYHAFKKIPPTIVKVCHVSKLILKDLGPNKECYPNHGYYRPSDRTVTINIDIFYHPDQPEDFIDSRRHYIDRLDHTIYHEFFHALDHQLEDISLKPTWMSLSGWSENYKPGLKQLRIKEKGAPEVIGEYYYDPKFEECFTRFYAKRNPYDDFADSGAYYVGGLRDKVPESKRRYLDHLLKPLYN